MEITYNMQYISGILPKMLIYPQQRKHKLQPYTILKKNQHKIARVLSLRSKCLICSCVASTHSTICTILFHTKIKQQTLLIPKLSPLLKTNLSSTSKLFPKKLFYEWLHDKIKDNFRHHDNDNNHPFHTVPLKTCHPYFSVTLGLTNRTGRVLAHHLCCLLSLSVPCLYTLFLYRQEKVIILV